MGRTRGPYGGMSGDPTAVVFVSRCEFEEQVVFVSWWGFIHKRRVVISDVWICVCVCARQWGRGWLTCTYMHPMFEIPGQETIP